MTSKSSVRVSQISYVIQQIKNYICVHIESVYHNHQLFSRKQGYFKNLLSSERMLNFVRTNHNLLEIVLVLQYFQ